MRPLRVEPHLETRCRSLLGIHAGAVDLSCWLIGGTAIHSSQVLPPESSLRTHSSALNPKLVRKCRWQLSMLKQRLPTSVLSCSESSTMLVQYAGRMLDSTKMSAQLSHMASLSVCQRLGIKAPGSNLFALHFMFLS